MLYDFLSIDRLAKTPAYYQIYDAIKNAIINNEIKLGDKLPSVRKLSEDLKLSKTTIESAYNQLSAEGYIIGKPYKGFFVLAKIYGIDKSNGIKNEIQKKGISISARYDLSGKSVDTDSINLSLWKKYVKDILNSDYLISSYGNAQGEYELRNALTKYSYSVRGVVAEEDSIVIGAGTQPLIYMLCGLLKDFGNKVVMEKNGFMHGERVFKDCGYKIERIENSFGGLDIDALYKSSARILFINPSGNMENSSSIKINTRYKIIEWAAKTDSIIIEDDYNGELRYTTHPFSAMQNYDTDRIVYLGSFSKLLLPSVRIGYMVLCRRFLNEYKKRLPYYNQTASKTEQLALAKYINDRRLEKHLRRLRKQYLEKSTQLLKEIKNFWGVETSATLYETSLAVAFCVHSHLKAAEADKKLSENSISVISIRDCTNGKINIKLGFSGIQTENIHTAVELLYNTIKA